MTILFYHIIIILSGAEHGEKGIHSSKEHSQDTVSISPNKSSDRLKQRGQDPNLGEATATAAAAAAAVGAWLGLFGYEYTRPFHSFTQYFELKIEIQGMKMDDLADTLFRFLPFSSSSRSTIRNFEIRAIIGSNHERARSTHVICCSFPSWDFTPSNDPDHLLVLCVLRSGICSININTVMRCNLVST